MKKILIVGCGFAGAVYARTLAENGYDVHCIDKRDHIAGNAYDFVDQNGVRVHRYGPHLFHTNNEKVFSWLKQFGEFVAYEHKVACQLEAGRLVPFPINRSTIEEFFGVELEDEKAIEAFMKDVRSDISAPKNAAEMLENKVGRELTETFFRRYTKKMWDMDLEDIHASVVSRVKIRFDREDRYFPGDAIQVMPKDGYTAIFETILNHENIHISLETDFAHAMLAQYDYCFNSMAVDEFYDFALGELPYRSIKFHTENRLLSETDNWAVVNYTDEGPFTRETRWHNIPCHYDAAPAGGAMITVTREEPCDYKANDMERYYPVKTSDDRYVELYKKYALLAEKDKDRLSFIGRCGTYQYLDMHQVINQSLIGAHRWLQEQSEQV